MWTDSDRFNWENLGKEIYGRRPTRSTGIYVTREGVKYGFRRNPRKYPPNFIPFSSFLENERDNEKK